MEALAPHEVDEIVEPLRAWCRQTGRPHRLDDNGRRLLALLGRAALEAGVEAIRHEATTNPAITRPVGLLIDRARRGDPDTFTPSHTSTADHRSSTPRPDPDCDDCAGTGHILERRSDGRDYTTQCDCHTATPAFDEPDEPQEVSPWMAS